jgi:hypothetical protein
MRTKALIGLAALAVGAMTAAAQSSVYSLNVVGYYNVTIPANSFYLIANQLNTTNNTLNSLLPSVPPGTEFYKYNGGYTTYIFDELDSIWTPDGNATLNPGEGGLIKNVTASPLTITFVGEVLQGNLTNAMPVGFAIRSSMVPQAGGVSSVLGLPATPGDEVYTYNNGYTTYIFDELDAIWTPSEPTVNVGQAFLARKVSGTNWVRNFNVQ